jgi:RNA polymerase sigma factor (sigma-70 family)
MNLEYIYHHHGDALFSICRRYTSSYEEAEDVFHDGLIHIEKHLYQFKGNGSLEGWCKRLMVTVAAGKHRVKKQESSALEQYGNGNETITEQPEFEKARTEIYNADFDGEEIREIIQSLPNKCQMVFNLYVFEELKHKQIAKQLNITVGTSKSQLKRARKLIHDNLYKKAMKKRKREMVRATILIIMTDPYGYIDKMAKERVITIVDKAPLVNVSALSKGLATSTGKSAFVKLISGWKTIIIAGTVSVSVITGSVILQKKSENIQILEPREHKIELLKDLSPDLELETKMIKAKSIFEIENNQKVYKKIVHYDTVIAPRRVLVRDTLKAK